MRGPELLAPASEPAMVTAAAQGGADAVYFGLSALNMRDGARNFHLEQLAGTVDRCRDLGLRAYLTVNTLVFDDEGDLVRRMLDEAVRTGVSAVIGWDPAVVTAAVERGLEVHLSTQASVANVAAARFWKSQGVSRVILARELSLEQVAHIKREAGLEIECFVHGALCLAVSGRCLLSLYTSGCSGNRGRCVQPCRREYEVRDVETGDRFRVGNHFVLSPRDLCALPFVDRLMDAGVDCFKIEGRNRSPEYVRVVVSCYRRAIEAARRGELTQDLVDERRLELQSVYNRNFSDGFYFGLPAAGGWAGLTGSAATHRKVFVGKVVNFYRRHSVAVLHLHGRHVAEGDDVMVIGPTTGVIHQRVDELQIEREPVSVAPKGGLVAVKTREPWRRGDKVFTFEPVVEPDGHDDE